MLGPDSGLTERLQQFCLFAQIFIALLSMLAPAGTPAPIVRRLDRDMKELLAVPEIRKAFSDQGVEPDYQDSAGFRAFTMKEIASWKQVVEEANIKLE